MTYKFAPREVFEQILEWSVIPTFDLLLEYGDQGVVMLRRSIEPYKNAWALPGLRVYKGEGIEDTLKRIAKQELNIDVNPSQRIFLGQYMGKFKTEHHRQDLSTGYLIKLNGDEKLQMNREHVDSMRIVKKPPAGTGSMYKYYFSQYQVLKSLTKS